MKKSVNILSRITLLTILIVVVMENPLLATHNRAGTITYRQLSGLNYEITLITFTKFGPGIVADRPELEIHFGDNTSEVVARISMVDDNVNFIRTNTYITTHTYPGPGTYEIFMEDPNRNDGVVNIPNSVTIPFSIRTTLILNPGLGYNSSPILLNPAIDFYAVNKSFIYNPAAFDAEGDSLSYRLVPCTGENGEPIENYTLPEASDTLYIDPITGDFVWDKPTVKGIFNIAIMIEEWRNGYKIGEIVRDIQFETKETDNDAPIIKTIDDTCVMATDTLKFEVSATDANMDKITLSAIGGTFLVESPSVFDEKEGLGEVNSFFTWNTGCTHIRNQPFLVVFRAEDDDPELNLVDNKNVNIRVNAPPVENVELFPTNNSMKIEWGQTQCSNAVGYKIYRKNEPVNFVPNVCETGMPDSLEFNLVTTINDITKTSYIDNNNGKGLNQGYKYCYYITSFFTDGAESYVSDETCSSLVRGIPVLTNVSVYDDKETTDSIYVAWSKPTELNVDSFPGPYKYYIYRSSDLWGEFFDLVDSTWINGLDDTIYIDRSPLLDAHETPYSYKVELYNDQPGNYFLIFNPMVASTPFLKINADDNKLHLEIEKNTPWKDSIIQVYRYSPQSDKFDSIAIANEITYTDSGLVNGNDYYYYVKTVGYYPEPGFIRPIINNSQKNMGVPKDTIPPCSPDLIVSSLCDSVFNYLEWNYPSCGDDVYKYYIYYSPLYYEDPHVIDSTENAQQLTYIHRPEKTMAGCYYVAAIDTFYNESLMPELKCVEGCNYYSLPNVFTPNGDGINDLFIPITSASLYNKYVDKINMVIYNRWGQPVTDVISDPAINWDGKSSFTKTLLPDGVYYYVCDVYEYNLLGLSTRTLVGFIQLLGRNDNKHN